MQMLWVSDALGLTTLYVITCPPLGPEVKLDLKGGAGLVAFELCSTSHQQLLWSTAESIATGFIKEEAGSMVAFSVEGSTSTAHMMLLKLTENQCYYFYRVSRLPHNTVSAGQSSCAAQRATMFKSLTGGARMLYAGHNNSPVCLSARSLNTSRLISSTLRQ